MEVLVTGASGFVGGRLVRALRQAGHRPRALVRPSSDRSGVHGIPCVIGDLDVPASLLRAVDGIDAVVHAAARVDEVGTREAFLRTNLHGTTGLLTAARRAGARRFVFVSTPSVLMDGRDQVDLHPNAPYPRRFLHAYAESKALAEQAVLAADDPDGFRTVALRPRGVWGPGDRTGPLPRLLARMRAGRLPDVSGGKQILADLCYIDHALDACLAALTADDDAVGGRAFFVTDGQPIDVWATTHALARHFDLPPPARRVPPRAARLAARGLDALYRLPPLHGRAPPLSRYGLALVGRSHTYDLGPTRAALGFAPTVTWDEGLARWTTWIAEQGGVQAYLDGVG